MSETVQEGSSGKTSSSQSVAEMLNVDRGNDRGDEKERGQRWMNRGCQRVWKYVPKEERHLSGDGGTDSIDDLNGQPDPVLEAPCDRTSV